MSTACRYPHFSDTPQIGADFLRAVVQVADNECFYSFILVSVLDPLATPGPSLYLTSILIEYSAQILCHRVLLNRRHPQAVDTCGQLSKPYKLGVWKPNLVSEYFRGRVNLRPGLIHCPSTLFMPVTLPLQKTKILITIINLFSE